MARWRLRWTEPARRGAYAAAAVVCAALLVGLLVRWLGWTPTDGRISHLDIQITVAADGRLEVREDVALRFASPERRPAVQRLLRTKDVLADGQVRAYDISDLVVVDGQGRRITPHTDELLRDLRLRFELDGAPEESRRAYTLRYTVEGAAEPRGEQTVVERDLATDGFGLPVETLSVAVTGPAMDNVSCLTGASETRRFCSTTSLQRSHASFGESGLGTGEGMALSLRYDPQLPQVDAPREAAAPVAYGSVVVGRAVLVLLLLLMIGALALWRQGQLPRVRRVTEPPFGARPAEVAVLVSGRAQGRQLGAALLDLARRGFVRIEAEPETGEVLLRQNRPEGVRDQLALYEWSLLLKVFRDVEVVRLADLRLTSREWADELLPEMERQVVSNRWRHSASTATWQRVGCLAAIGAGTLAYVMLVVLSVTRWPDLPQRDLTVGAVAALSWAAGCAHLWSRVRTQALTVRGRWWYAHAVAYAEALQHLPTGRDPAEDVWAVALGVRPDWIDLAPVDSGVLAPVPVVGYVAEEEAADPALPDDPAAATAPGSGVPLFDDGEDDGLDGDDELVRPRP